MNKLSTLSGLTVLLLFLTFSSYSQEKFTFPPNYQVDTRIDNMGYWQKCAEMGLVPVQPNYKPAPAKYTGSKIFLKGILIQDSPDVPVTTDNTTGQTENSIFVDPSNNLKVVNSNNSTPNPSNGTVYGTSTYSSVDGGDNWSGTKNGPGTTNNGDPAVCINMNGRWFEGYIDNGYGQSVSYSDNQGSSWTVVKVGNGNMANMCDKNHLWVDDSPSSTFPGYLYNGWMYSNQITVSHSANNGVSWSSPFAISNGTNAGSHNQGENFKTGPNGEAYCVWSVYDSWPSDEKALGFSKSLDGGVTWTPGVRALNNIRGTRTTGVGKNMRTNSFPSMTCDLSNGPNRGTLYIAWPNIGVPGVNTGSDVDVYMIKSTDQGVTWSTPTKVNQDPSGLGKKHYLSWITCDQASGILSVVFYDDRNVSASQTEVYMAWSMDGGNTWQDMKVSDVAFTPSPVPLMATSYMGDYLGITAFNGKTYPCWTDNRLGHCMAYVSPVDLVIPAAKIIYDANYLNDTTGGNGNNKMDFGETELLGLKMKNTGNAQSDSVTVTLSSPSPYISFDDNTEFYGNFAIGQSKTILNSYKFNVSDSLPGLTMVPFEAASSDKHDSITTSEFFILSHGPAITIHSMSISDPAPGGNGNGRLDPGETATLYIETENSGDYDLLNTLSDLMTNNPYVTINSANYNIGTLTAGAYVNAAFNITVSPACYHGCAARFHNIAHGGYQRATKDFIVKIGLIVEDWETAGFHKFNWIQGGDADWVIDPDVKWEGNYSAHSGAIAPGQTNELKLNYNVLYDDSISFFRKISTKGLSNFLKFYIDGNMVGQWSGNGNQNWIYTSYPVLAGQHEFKWVYNKAFAAGTDLDKVWVDFIVFPPEFVVANYAGSNASICAGSAYQLHGLAMNYDSLSWISGGTGTFNDAHIMNPLYTPSQQDITSGTVILTMHAYGQPNVDTASSMTLTIAPQPTGSAGENGTICMGSTYEIVSATASNYSSLHWSSAGDGAFSDNTLLHPVYTPGNQDKQAGTVKLTLTTNPVSSDCQSITSDMTLTIHANPVVNLGNDLTVYGESIVTLDATTSGATAYHWYPSGATTAVIHADTVGKGLGKQTIWVIVTNEFNCTGVDTVNVTFNKHPEGIETLNSVSFTLYPNPNDGKFTIDLNSMHLEILTIEVINVTGATMFSQSGFEVSGHITKTIDISNLSNGNYILRLSNGKEMIMQKFVIRK